ncbi:MAG: methylated-DNA--[protein]-cysteine S-methyltransferase [Ignavibacteriaceae bacterium]|nr:MAG: methylated-DNA--[protein]-cysteine S-methyltransferase [Ignavibacteriaceae bacterium]MBW7873446.1 methylated-DNA--[protein]-cysteine S-methyltransferase [Ignavibacteria bacterium]OQY76969.1 MAG: hypothetical protein B6D45_03220 [Ignavibacteriales bacterium UTCHB3]MBV6444873.1 Methylated-DNA--protein-cysteine methyltransferase, inducible [Ignavibacteriaceae bacterium]MBZ0197046.1 methylated-DNA--[protein]-cysteine S-methyltransferase [Ignavibacteriaceae bacterium]
MASNDKKKISISQFSSPIGTIITGALPEGVVFLEFLSEDNPDAQWERLKKKFDGEFTEDKNKHLENLKEQLALYFEGKLKKFDIPVIFFGTEFQKKVWNELLSIDYGKTRSYGEQARAIGKPKAARAIGGAVGDNPISIVVPCHRVIGSDGSLTGFGGGIPRKIFMLDLEKKYS